MEYLIGLDIGTSQIKAVLFDSFGTEVVTAAHLTRINSPLVKFMEQDMEQVWHAVLYCLRSLSSQAPDAVKAAQAVGISGQGEGLWLLDHNKQPVQSAILWNDGRSAATVADLSQKQIQDIREITLTTPIPSSTLVQLKWMHTHRPEVLEQAAYCIFCKDWIRFRLTGQILCEITDISVTLMDMKKKKLAEDIFSSLGLKEHIRLFPPMYESSSVSGHITEEAAEQTGLPFGIPVAAGALDVTATALGVKAVGENDLFLILGTTACSGLVVSPERSSPESGKYVLHPNPDYMIKIMATMAGTPNIDWLVQSIALTDDFSHLEHALSQTHPGSGGVLYFPYISPSGERYPFYHPHAKAGFFGITSSTSQNHLIRAVYEGVAFSVRDCLEDETTGGRIHIAGGGSRSDSWCQIISDCTHHEVIRFAGSEFGAKGAAILAGVCAGWYNSLDDMASAFCHEEKWFAPNPEAEDIYDDLYSLFHSIRLTYTDHWNAHQKILDVHSLR